MPGLYLGSRYRRGVHTLTADAPVSGCAGAKYASERTYPPLIPTFRSTVTHGSSGSFLVPRTCTAYSKVT